MSSQEIVYFPVSADSCEGEDLRGLPDSRIFLSEGMSGGTVELILDAESPHIVKQNKEQPEKVFQDYVGHMRLAESPLREHLLTPLHYSEEDASLVLPYFDGVSLRQKLRDGEDFRLAGVVDKLLTEKSRWWGKQEKLVPNGNMVSMQRSEWGETQELIDEASLYLAQQYGVDKHSFFNKSLVVDGEQLPSLMTTMEKVNSVLCEYPPYVIFAHNDASGANILVDEECSDWRLIDAEWSGYGDPAEALVRSTKYISTTTARNINMEGMLEHNENFEISISADFGETSLLLHQKGEEYSQILPRLLKDKEFESRYNMYLAGSYLREFALSLRRGTPEKGLYAAILAANSIK